MGRPTGWETPTPSPATGRRPYGAPHPGVLDGAEARGGGLGVEGTGCYGAALARFLAGQGQQVLTMMGPQDQPGNLRWSGSRWWARARTMQAGRPAGAGCVCSHGGPPRGRAGGAAQPRGVAGAGADRGDRWPGLVGGRNAELLGLLVSPPILAASFVGPKRTVAVGLVALAAAIGYGRAVGVDLLAGSQGVPRSRSGSRPCCRGWWRESGWSGKGGCGRSPGSPRSPSGRCWAGCPRRWGACAWPCCTPRPAPRRRSGDFYEALETPHGVRLLVGDVRGKGLDAVRLAGVVLGSFRDAAQDRPDLAEVAAALDRSVTRAIGPEDFVTAVAVQVLGDGSAVVVNCGHPALLVRGGQATELDPPEPAPPLGLSPRPSRCGRPWRWATGSCCTPMG